MKELKALYFHSFQDFMKAVIRLTKAGHEVDMTQTRIVYGRMYHLKYWEYSASPEQVEDLLAEQEPVAEIASSEAEVATNYDELSDDELRELAKEAKVQGWYNAKRETLIAKLQAKA